MENEKKQMIIKIAVVMVVTFIAAFLAFYTALAITVNKLTNPNNYEKRMEKMIKNRIFATGIFSRSGKNSFR